MARTVTTAPQTSARAKLTCTESTSDTEEVLSLGWGSLCRPVAARREYMASAPYICKYRTFHQVGGEWVESCTRCDGAGNIGWGPHQGVCYRCVGHGAEDRAYTTTELDTRMRSWARGIMRQSVKETERIAALHAENTAWRAANPELVAWVMNLEADGRELAHSYATVAETREEARKMAGPMTEIDVSDERVMDGGTRFGVRVRMYEETFSQFSGKVASMLRPVRAGSSLTARETAYLTKVMESARRVAAEGVQGRWAGNEGQRLVVDGRVAMVADASNAYGARLRVVVEGTGEHDGVRWTTWTSVDSAWDLVKGQAVRVRGTIRRNEEYQGRRCSVVTRPVFTVM